MKIIPLSEGTFTIDQTKRFVPFRQGRDKMVERSKGSLLVEVQPFVVVTEKDVLLLDTGLGFTDAYGTLQIYQNLVDNNINPLDVTKVLLTHLHKDHAGGIAVEDKIINQQHLSFQNAVYYVQKQELDYAFKKGFPSYITEEIEILKNNDKLILLDGEGMIDSYIHYAISGAHCPYHQVYWIKEENETIFFGGDEAPQLHQMKSRFVAKYDYNGKKAMELRQQWWEQGSKENWTFLFYHDIQTPYFAPAKDK
jgi:glyoxylase-like metal-dependent hydrolase (beta-lactamase superfamily II)